MKHLAPSRSTEPARRAALPLLAGGTALGLLSAGLSSTALAAGNADCSSATATGIKVESGELFTSPVKGAGGFTVTISDVQGKRSDVRSFDYTATAGLVELIVKGGPTSYSVPNPPLVGNDVVGPADGGGGTFGVSNVTFCFELPVTAPIVGVGSPPASPPPSPSASPSASPVVSSSPGVSASPAAPTASASPVVIGGQAGGATPSASPSPTAGAPTHGGGAPAAGGPLSGVTPGQPATAPQAPAPQVPAPQVPGAQAPAPQLPAPAVPAPAPVGGGLPIGGVTVPQPAQAAPSGTAATGAAAAVSVLPFTGSDARSAAILAWAMIASGGLAALAGRRPRYVARHAL